MSKTTLALLFALALGVSATGCSPEVPAAPTYTKDVQPILAAHCVRCHDETFRTDPVGILGNKTPLLCHLNRYGNMPADCPDPATCSYGAGSPSCATMIPALIVLPDGEAKRMPPAPADPLNDWEKDVLTRWGRTNPPPP